MAGLRTWNPWLTAALLVLCTGAVGASAEVTDLADVTVETGALDDAHFTLLKPFDWDGRILVTAHGWRPPGGPLVADLNPEDPVPAALLADGWLVATTSYRRNGLIIDDAQTDLMNLLAHIVRRYGASNRIVLEGASMGAMIATLMAEAESRDWSHIRRMFQIHGVVAIGGDFAAEGPDGPLDWSWQPGVPLILVSNRSELAPAVDYAFRANTAPVKPVLWCLERDGHVNINSAERLRAIEALDQWLETGRRPDGAPPYGLDVTVDRSDRASVAVPSENGLLGMVVNVDVAYGNLDTDFVVADLDELGIDRRFRVRCGETTRKVFFGETYDDVEPGKLVAFVNAEGGLRLAVNRGNAARRLDCGPGDELELLPPRNKKADRKNQPPGN